MLIDRYLIKEWCKIFAIMIGATIGLLLMEDAYKNLHNFITHSKHIHDILFYYGIKCIEFIPTVITLSIFLSLLYLLGTLNRNNEITAMRASGISLFRISMPLLTMALVCSFILFLLNANWVPWAKERTREIQLMIESDRTVDDRAIASLSFDFHPANRLWIVNRFTLQHLYGVSVYQLNNNRVESKRIVAEEALYQKDCSWRFLNGRVISFDEKTGDIVRSQFFESLDENFEENPKNMWMLQQKPNTLSRREIKTLINSHPFAKNIQEFHVRYYEILFLPISCLIVAMLAIPFAISGIRTNPLTGISKAISGFFAYYLSINIGSLLATQGTLSPLCAAFIPNLLMLLLAILLYRRATEV